MRLLIVLLWVFVIFFLFTTWAALDIFTALIEERKRSSTLNFTASAESLLVMIILLIGSAFAACLISIALLDKKD